MSITTKVDRNNFITVQLENTCTILNNISVWNLSGDLIMEMDIHNFINNDTFSINIPCNSNKGNHLISISTNLGNYSQLIEF